MPDDDELRDDPMYRVFRGLREQVVELSGSFTRDLRERIDELAVEPERRPPPLLRVLLEVVLDATNLLAGLASGEPTPPDGDDHE